jgi:hypothetical protein
MLRMKLTPKLGASVPGKRSVVNGIAISAVQPAPVTRATTSQIPSQLRLTLELLAFPRVLPSPSSVICCSSLAPSGVVTNM